MRQCGAWRESVGLRSDEILMIRPLAEVSFLLFQAGELSAFFSQKTKSLNMTIVVYEYGKSRI